jgi:AcrR family transcriptional regulator
MDRRVLRTRRVLREALLALIFERGWDRVTVHDVCARADVGRSTFYTHFADREDLLLSGFVDLKAELRARDPRPLGFVGGLIAHVDQNRALARRVLRRRGGPPVRQRIGQLVVELLEEDLAAMELPPGLVRTATARYLGGALLDLLLWRLEGAELSGTELEALSHRLSEPALRA